MGYVIVLKPTLELPSGIVKGNVDAELVLHTMINFHIYDNVVIISGDGDFFCLIEYLAQKNKLLRIMTPNKYYSKLYRPYMQYIVRVDQLKDFLIKK